MAYASSTIYYLQDYKRHSVAVSQRSNDHMQVYIFIIDGI